MEAKDLNHLGFEPEHVQVLLHNAICELGPQNFVGLRQAALYALMFWGTARFEEVRELEMRQIMKKGASYEIKIYKGKANQTRKLQKCIIHPNALEYLRNYCPVTLLHSYLAAHTELGHPSN